MDLQRALLIMLALGCLWDLEKTWRVARSCPEPLRVLLYAGAASHEVEGFVRYLHWEIDVRNRLTAEIALDIEDPGGETQRVAEYLLRDGLIVEKMSAEPSLVFTLQTGGASVR